ncbi:hypothetical protein [Cyanobium sp. Aljojuca 7A6]|nr:hypothetical protein [Cyanobium sp. Aljojuca 7A6]MCP9834102.1 hypothetical protein [Cyanobium sp. La Preciosa 7G6]MCP9936865.1 hypothetical protein [Cyanobium sp. Aljojuca 7A6]
MNRGVWTAPWGVVKQPQRARVRGQRAVIVKSKSKAMAPNLLSRDAKRVCCDATRGFCRQLHLHRRLLPPPPCPA